MKNEFQEQEYRARINRVMDYIQQHLHVKLTVAALASVACFSPYHFHRIFRAMTGETLTGFIQRLRIEKAASLLVYNPKLSITEIAFTTGFGSPASFARLFREIIGMSATQWRNGGYRQERKIGKVDSSIGKTKSSIGKESASPSGYIDIQESGGADRSDLYFNFHSERKIAMSITQKAEVNVDVLPEITVAYVRHIGPYKGDATLFGRLFGKLMQWAGPRGLMQGKDVSCLSVYHDDPEVTDPDKLRLSVCVTVPPETLVSGEIGKMEIEAGSYAVGHFELSDTEFQDAWNYMYGEWLPQSGYQPDDRPCFERCCNDPSTHPENKHIIDICIPVKPL